MRVGVFGGTFNPVHYGHLRAAEEAAEALNLKRVLFVPAGSPPLKNRGVVSTDDRLSMVELAIAGNPCFELSRVETAKSGKSYSVDTFEELSSLEADDLVFILGIDAFCDIHRWHHPERLLSLADFAVLGRPGYPFAPIAQMPYVEGVSDEDIALLDQGHLKRAPGLVKGGRRLDILSITPMGISATDIRHRLAGGQSVRYLLPESVESFIMSNGLYTEQAG